MEQVSELLQRTNHDPSSSLTALVDALQTVLQAGHIGNRSVARGDVWGVVVAATRAFPIQLSPSVEKAQEVIAAAAVDGADHSSSLLHTWILQAAADGSLPVLVQKLHSQPQILTAYARDAPLRQPATVDALVAALQELQALIPVSPYDRYMQAKKAASASAGQAAPDQKPPAVHIQTESDLAQQQQPSPSNSTNADAQGGHGSSNSNGSSQASAAGASSSPATASQPAGEQKGLVGRLRSARLPQLGSFSKKGPQQQQQQQQHGGTALLQVQLLVATPEQLSSAPDRLVQLHVQVTEQQPDARQQQKHAAGSNANSSSRDTASPPAPSSVKGLLQGLQQSAASGLQQAAATAAGQAAVAAAGGAVAAALGSVKGWNRFEGGRRQQQQQDAAAAAGSGTDSSRISGSSRRQAGGRQLAKPPPAAAAAGVAKDNEWRLVAVQLQLRAAEDAAAQGLVQLQLNVLPGPPAAAAAAAASDTRDAAGWSTRGMLDRLRLPRGSASAGSSSNSSSRAPSQQHEVAVVEALSVGQEGQEQQAADAEALLEGDIWSVMSRLKAGSSSMLAARAGDNPAAAAAAEAAAQQLAASAQLLQQQLASCCSAVCAAAADSKGSLGEESPELLQLIDSIKQLLSHGLNNSGGSSSAQAAGANNSSSSSRGSTPEPGGPAGGGSMAAAVKAAATARDMLGGLLMQGRQQSAFGVLQALQHGSKQQPRLMLGADGIANMKAAKSAPPAVKLDLWVRASLNEQLLGVRISTLLANPDALTPWYQPGALLLQHSSMAAVMQELQELSLHRFALPVDAAAAAAAAAATAGAAGDKAANSAPVKQQQQGAGMSAAASNRSSSMTAALDPRKYLGGFSVGLGSLRASSTTAAAGSPTAAVDAGTSGSNPAPSSSSALPTFLWGPDGGGSTSSGPPAAAPAGTAGSAGAAAATAAAAAAAAAAATAATGGFFRRRRVPQIKEVRVPPPGSGAVLSREPSSTLSPVSTEGDTAYAEWWSPNNSAQDLTAAAVDGGTGSGAGRRFGSSNSLRSGGSSGLLGDGGGTPRSPMFVRSASRRSHAGSEASTGATSEAALQLEQDLQAAMSAPLLVEQLSARRSSGSAGGGGAIRRSGSAGWDAAVARAKSSAAAAGPTVGLGPLSRRSRSPEAAAGTAGGGSGVSGARRPRHMHKRSSSLNDLPELEALWMDGSAGGGG